MTVTLQACRQPRWLSGLRRSRVHSLWLLVDHCVLRNWDRILVRAVKGLISRAGMVSICPLLWQRDVKLQQTNKLQACPPQHYITQSLIMYFAYLIIFKITHSLDKFFIMGNMEIWTLTFVTQHPKGSFMGNLYHHSQEGNTSMAENVWIIRESSLFVLTLSNMVFRLCCEHKWIVSCHWFNRAQNIIFILSNVFLGNS